MLEAVAAAARTAAAAAVEAESAERVATLFRKRLGRVQLADGVEGADVARGIRARGAADRRLVDHDDRAERLRTFDALVRARRLGRLAEPFAQRRIQHVLHERRFAGSGHAGDAHQPVQRDRDIDVFEIVLTRAANVQGVRWR
jgi:hypothetical protein